MKRLSPIVLLAALAVSGCSGGGDRSASGLTPDFTLPAVDAGQVRLSDQRGKVVIVDFWATWCPPCRDMIPVLSRLAVEYGPRGLVVIGVSLDEGGLPVVRPFVQAQKMPYRVVLATPQVTRAFGGIGPIPTVFILNREGRLVRKLEGSHTYEQMVFEISRYL